MHKERYGTQMREMLTHIGDKPPRIMTCEEEYCGFNSQESQTTYTQK